MVHGEGRGDKAHHEDEPGLEIEVESGREQQSGGIPGHHPIPDEARLDEVHVHAGEKHLAGISPWLRCEPNRVTGVTTNPTILRAEGKIDFYAHLRRIREIIGADRTLHVQVLAKDTRGVIDDAHRLLDKIDGNVYPKIPTTEAGIAAMRQLKQQGAKVTATAIYSKTPGLPRNRHRRRLPGSVLQPDAEPRHRHPRHA